MTDLIKNIDTSFRAQDDFYDYATGGWQKAHPLTGEYARFGTFDLLSETTRSQVKDLIMHLDSHPDASVKGTDAQKICDIYRLGMDEERLNREGATPLLPFLERIERFRREDLEDTLAWLHLGLTGSFFGCGVGSDPKDSDKNILFLSECGLGLGDRDYYLVKSEHNDKILEAYRTYVQTVMRLAGYDEEACVRIRETVIRLETEFARNKRTREERRDPTLSYNPTDLNGVLKTYPSFRWDLFFDKLGLKGIETINVSNPAFFKFINDYLPAMTDREIKDYLAYDLVSESSALLSDDFTDANFEMFGRVMSGRQEKKPRWKRVMTIPNSMFGEAVGKLYVEKYFPAVNKEYMLRLVENLRGSLAKHIDKLSWMSEATKIKALEKLDTLRVKIGYPDKWKDYSGIEIDPDLSYMENVYRASLWYTRDNLEKLGKPVDREEWFMMPQTVNAYYSPVFNEICFPAGILQPPYFDIAADDALNYGAIGVVIGHEMTHGYDDQGRQFDKNGNLSEWWTPEDAEKFNKLADRLVAQFDAVEVAPGVHANGRFTLGENIADQGGLRIALTAYLDNCKASASREIDGYTALQRFYLSYAGVWADNIREEEILSRTQTDPHSLGRNRVNVTLKNLSPFMEAFDVKEGDKMFRAEDDRVIIW